MVGDVLLALTVGGEDVAEHLPVQLGVRICQSRDSAPTLLDVVLSEPLLVYQEDVVWLRRAFPSHWGVEPVT